MVLTGLRESIGSRVLGFLSYRAKMLYYSYNWYLRIVAFLATIIRVSRGQSHNLAQSKCKTPVLCMLSIRVVKRKKRTVAGVCLVEGDRRLARSSTKERSHVVVEVVWRSEAACRGVCLAE